jgi:hypothetical protein
VGKQLTAAAIELTVPAHPDFVAVLRVAARAIAGRAGRADDARSRLQAAVGAAFFAMTDSAPPGSAVVAHLRSGAERVEMTLMVDAAAPGLVPEQLADLATEHELSPDGRSIRIWVTD